MSRFLKMGLIYIVMMVFMELSVLFFSWVPQEVMKNFGQFIVILMPVLLIALVLKMDFKERFKINRFKLSTVFVCLIIAIAVLPINGFLGELTTYLFGNNPDGISTFVEGMKGSIGLRWFIIAVTPAICEEFMFRGLLLDKKIGLNMHVLAIASGLMFSLFHVGFDQLLYTFPLGMIFAYVTIITNSIFPAILMHLFNNSIGTIFELISLNGAEDAVVEKTAEGGNAVATSLGIFIIPAVIGGVIIFFAIKKLIKDYKYDDLERVKSNIEDSKNMRREATVISILPQLIVFSYVILINLMIKVNG